MVPLASILFATLIAGGPMPETRGSGELLRVHHAPWHLGEADAPQNRRSPANEAPMMSSEDRATARNWQTSNPSWTPPPAPPPAAMDRMRPGFPIPSTVPRASAPNSLVLRLPGYPGFSYVVVGASLLLVDSRTNTIVDILWDVFKTGTS
jgi:hypothetical protein